MKSVFCKNELSENPIQPMRYIGYKKEKPRYRIFFDFYPARNYFENTNASHFICPIKQREKDISIFCVNI